MMPAPNRMTVEESPATADSTQTEVFPEVAGSPAPARQLPPAPQPPPPQGVQPRPKASSTPGLSQPQSGLLYGSLLDFSPTRPRRATRQFFVSTFTHVLVLALLTLLPLFFTESIDLTQFTRTQLVAPPPPPPPPPPPAALVTKSRQLPRRLLLSGGKLLAPTVIPQNVAMVREKPLPPEIDSGAGAVEGGVPGGVPGGQFGGVLGSILSSGQHPVLPAIAPPAKPSAPVRVGGRVKEPRKISAPPPEYPVLARQAHVEGVVVIEAIIDERGDVVDARALSGHPLLMKAALDAVRQWKFEPTYLNDQPVAVQLVVSVGFHLNQ